MNWLGLIKSLFSFLTSFTEWLRERKLIKSGEAQTIARVLTDADKIIRESNKARDAASNVYDRDKLHHSDGYRRD